MKQKKMLSLLLAAATLVSGLSLTAFAQEENPFVLEDPYMIEYSVGERGLNFSSEQAIQQVKELAAQLKSCEKNGAEYNRVAEQLRTKCKAAGISTAALGKNFEGLDDAVTAGRNAHEAMRRTTDADRDRDCSLDMAVSYGLDCDNDDDRREDYYTVRGLK